jgi:hypothetical protein
MTGPVQENSRKVLMLSERASGQTSAHIDFLETLLRRFGKAGMQLFIPHHTRVLPVLLEEGDISLAVIDLDSPGGTGPVRTIARLKMLHPHLPVITIGGPRVSAASIDNAALLGADIHLQVQRVDEQSIQDLVDCAFELANGDNGFSAKAGYRTRIYTMSGRLRDSRVENYLFIEPDL